MTATPPLIGIAARCHFTLLASQATRPRERPRGPCRRQSAQCIDATEEGRFLPSITLAYNIAAVLERYVYEVFPPQGPTPRPLPQSSGASHQVSHVTSRESSLHPGGLK